MAAVDLRDGSLDTQAAQKIIHDWEVLSHLLLTFFSNTSI